MFAYWKLDVWGCCFDLLQPVHVTKVCVHAKNSVVVAVLHNAAKYLLQQWLPVRSKGHSRSGCSL